MKKIIIAAIIVLALFVSAAQSCEPWERLIPYTIYDNGQQVSQFDICATYTQAYFRSIWPLVYAGPGWDVFEIGYNVYLVASYSGPWVSAISCFYYF